VNNERHLEQIKNDIKIITTNKLSVLQSKLLFMGITYEIILRKDLFPQNEDLKKFINNIYIENFEDKIPFRDYLYDSRTMLGARIQKKILSDLSYEQITTMVNKIYNLLPSKDIKKISRSKKSENMDKEVVEWMNFIRNKGLNNHELL